MCSTLRWPRGCIGWAWHQFSLTKWIHRGIFFGYPTGSLYGVTKWVLSGVPLDIHCRSRLPMTTKVLLTAFLLVVGCGGGSDTKAPTDPDPEPETQPANVTAISAEHTHSAAPGGELVTLHLVNTGGPGAYRIEAWGYSRKGDGGIVNGSRELYGETEPVEVFEGYDEMRAWDFFTGTTLDGALILTHLTVFTRDQGNAQYYETARVDLQ